MSRPRMPSASGSSSCSRISLWPLGLAPNPEYVAHNNTLRNEDAGNSPSTPPAAEESTYSPHPGYLLYHAALDRYQRHCHGMSISAHATESPVDLEGQNEILRRTVASTIGERDAARADYDALKFEHAQQAVKLRALRRANEALRDNAESASIESGQQAAEIHRLRREMEEASMCYDRKALDLRIERDAEQLRYGALQKRTRALEGELEDGRAAAADRVIIEKRCAILESLVEAKDETIAALQYQYARLGKMFDATVNVSQTYLRRDAMIDAKEEESVLSGDWVEV